MNDRHQPAIVYQTLESQGIESGRGVEQINQRACRMKNGRTTNRRKRGSVSIFCKSCESMRELDSGTVALTVTSPPYYRAIDYPLHAKDPTRNYREQSYSGGYTDYRSYLAWLQRIFIGEVWRVTKHGGFCAIVVGTVLEEGRQYPIPAALTSRLMDGGWEFWDKITWNKCCAGVKRAGVAIQHPYPGYFFPNVMTEEILIFRKPGDPIYRSRAIEEKQAARFPVDELFLRDTANNIWSIPPVPPHHLEHPCPFPEEIPFRIIQMYSYPGELVLDTFCGSGQTLKVAHHLGRRAVGYEIVEEYVALARKRVGEALELRAEQIVVRYDKILRVAAPDSTVGHRRQHHPRQRTERGRKGIRVTMIRSTTQ